jgi:hypothetical protein
MYTSEDGLTVSKILRILVFVGSVIARFITTICGTIGISKTTGGKLLNYYSIFKIADIFLTMYSSFHNLESAYAGFVSGFPIYSSIFAFFTALVFVGVSLRLILCGALLS